MNIRQPFRAGSFYEAAPDTCRRQAEQLLAGAQLPADLPQSLCGGLVPHAGWAFSGPLAALTIKALCAEGPPDTFVLLGADHAGQATRSQAYARGAWLTPLGEALIDEKLADALVASPVIDAGHSAHDHEHSIEVQVPLIQTAAPNARIVPVAVSSNSTAVQVGQAIAKALLQADRRVVIVGSTDLTHHGGHFGSPHGSGEAGEQWSRSNDHRMLALVESMDAEAVIPEAAKWRNACGAGAIAACISACKVLGASAGRVLGYTNSYEIAHSVRANYGDDTTVGYASVIFA